MTPSERTSDRAQSRVAESARWVTAQELAARYSHPVKKVIAKANRGAWPCHRQGSLIRFSPEDQAAIAEKWGQFHGDDPPVRQQSYIQLLMEEAVASQEERTKRTAPPDSLVALWSSLSRFLLTLPVFVESESYRDTDGNTDAHPECQVVCHEPETGPKGDAHTGTHRHTRVRISRVLAH